MSKPLSVLRKFRCFEAEVSEQYRSLTVAATTSLEGDSSASYTAEASLVGCPAVIIDVGLMSREMSIDMAVAVVNALNEAIAAAKGGAA